MRQKFSLSEPILKNIRQLAISFEEGKFNQQVAMSDHELIKKIQRACEPNGNEDDLDLTAVDVAEGLMLYKLFYVQDFGMFQVLLHAMRESSEASQDNGNQLSGANRLTAIALSSIINAINKHAYFVLCLCDAAGGIDQEFLRALIVFRGLPLLTRLRLTGLLYTSEHSSMGCIRLAIEFFEASSTHQVNQEHWDFATKSLERLVRSSNKGNRENDETGAIGFSAAKIFKNLNLQGFLMRLGHEMMLDAHAAVMDRVELSNKSSEELILYGLFAPGHTHSILNIIAEAEINFLFTELDALIRDSQDMILSFQYDLERGQQVKASKETMSVLIKSSIISLPSKLKLLTNLKYLLYEERNEIINLSGKAAYEYVKLYELFFPHKALQLTEYISDGSALEPAALIQSNSNSIVELINKNIVNILTFARNDPSINQEVLLKQIEAQGVLPVVRLQLADLLNQSTISQGVYDELWETADLLDPDVLYVLLDSSRECKSLSYLDQHLQKDTASLVNTIVASIDRNIENIYSFRYPMNSHYASVSQKVVEKLLDLADLSFLSRLQLMSLLSQSQEGMPNYVSYSDRSSDFSRQFFPHKYCYGTLLSTQKDYNLVCALLHAKNQERIVPYLLYAREHNDLSLNALKFLMRDCIVTIFKLFSHCKSTEGTAYTRSSLMKCLQTMLIVPNVVKVELASYFFSDSLRAESIEKFDDYWGCGTDYSFYRERQIFKACTRAPALRALLDPFYKVAVLAELEHASFDMREEIERNLKLIQLNYRFFSRSFVCREDSDVLRVWVGGLVDETSEARDSIKQEFNDLLVSGFDLEEQIAMNHSAGKYSKVEIKLYSLFNPRYSVLMQVAFEYNYLYRYKPLQTVIAMINRYAEKIVRFNYKGAGISQQMVQKLLSIPEVRPEVKLQLAAAVKPAASLNGEVMTRLVYNPRFAWLTQKVQKLQEELSAISSILILEEQQRLESVGAGNLIFGERFRRGTGPHYNDFKLVSSEKSNYESELAASKRANCVSWGSSDGGEDKGDLGPFIHGLFAEGEQVPLEWLSLARMSEDFFRIIFKGVFEGAGSDPGHPVSLNWQVCKIHPDNLAYLSLTEALDVTKWLENEEIRDYYLRPEDRRSYALARSFFIAVLVVTRSLAEGKEFLERYYPEDDEALSEYALARFEYNIIKADHASGNMEEDQMLIHQFFHQGQELLPSLHEVMRSRIKDVLSMHEAKFRSSSPSSEIEISSFSLKPEADNTTSSSSKLTVCFIDDLLVLLSHIKAGAFLNCLIKYHLDLMLEFYTSCTEEKKKEFLALITMYKPSEELCSLVITLQDIAQHSRPDFYSAFSSMSPLAELRLKGLLMHAGKIKRYFDYGRRLLAGDYLLLYALLAPENKNSSYLLFLDEESVAEDISSSILKLLNRHANSIIKWRYDAQQGREVGLCQESLTRLTDFALSSSTKFALLAALRAVEYHENNSFLYEKMDKTEAAMLCALLDPRNVSLIEEDDRNFNYSPYLDMLALLGNAGSSIVNLQYIDEANGKLGACQKTSSILLLLPNISFLTKLVLLSFSNYRETDIKAAATNAKIRLEDYAVLYALFDPSNSAKLSENVVVKQSFYRGDLRRRNALMNDKLQDRSSLEDDAMLLPFLERHSRLWKRPNRKVLGLEDMLRETGIVELVEKYSLSIFYFRYNTQQVSRVAYRALVQSLSSFAHLTVSTRLRLLALAKHSLEKLEMLAKKFNMKPEDYAVLYALFDSSNSNVSSCLDQDIQMNGVLDGSIIDIVRNHSHRIFELQYEVQSGPTSPKTQLVQRFMDEFGMSSFVQVHFFPLLRVPLAYVQARAEEVGRSLDAYVVFYTLFDPQNNAARLKHFHISYEQGRSYLNETLAKLLDDNVDIIFNLEYQREDGIGFFNKDIILDLQYVSNISLITKLKLSIFYSDSLKDVQIKARETGMSLGNCAVLHAAFSEKNHLPLIATRAHLKHTSLDAQIVHLFDEESERYFDLQCWNQNSHQEVKQSAIKFWLRQKSISFETEFRLLTLFKGIFMEMPSELYTRWSPKEYAMLCVLFHPKQQKAVATLLTAARLKNDSLLAVVTGILNHNIDDVLAVLLQHKLFAYSPVIRSIISMLSVSLSVKSRLLSFLLEHSTSNRNNIKLNMRATSNGPSGVMAFSSPESADALQCHLILRELFDPQYQFAILAEIEHISSANAEFVLKALIWIKENSSSYLLDDSHELTKLLRKVFAVLGFIDTHESFAHELWMKPPDEKMSRTEHAVLYALFDPHYSRVMLGILKDKELIKSIIPMLQQYYKEIIAFDYEGLSISKKMLDAFSELEPMVHTWFEGAEGPVDSLTFDVVDANSSAKPVKQAPRRSLFSLSTKNEVTVCTKFGDGYASDARAEDEEMLGLRRFD